MVAEPQEYKYNADAFEARKTSEAKQETAGKELPKVRKIKPDKFRGVGVKSCVLFICLKQFMIWRMFQEITRMD